MESKYSHSLEEFNPQVYALLKVGTHEHLRQIQEGKLWFRSLSYYKSLEKAQEPFHDPNEGLMGVYQSELITLTIQPEGMPPHTLSAEGGLVGQVLTTIDKNASVFCLYTLHSGQWTTRPLTEDERGEFVNYLHLTEKIKRHGDSYLLITDFKKFKDKLSEGCKKANVTLQGKLVQYVEPSTFHGNIPYDLVGFVKLKDYDGQREYRLLIDWDKQVDREPEDPFVLDVGSLADCTVISNIDEFNLEIKWGDPIPTDEEEGSQENV